MTKGLGPFLTFSTPGPHPGLPRQTRGPQSVGRSSPRASPALSPRAHPCACRAPAPAPWGTAGSRMDASSGKPWGRGGGEQGRVPSCWAAVSLSLGSSLSSCTPEGIICEDAECAGLGGSFPNSRHPTSLPPRPLSTSSVCVSLPPRISNCRPLCAEGPVQPSAPLLL